MKKIAILVKQYSINGMNPWLLDDLVEDLVSKGNHVTVFYFDMRGLSDKGYTKRCDRHDIYTFSYLNKLFFGLCKIRNINLIFSYIGMKKYFKKIIKNKEFDIVINYTGLFIFFGLSKYIKNRNDAKSISIFWDFYPLHFKEIGHLNNKFFEMIMYYLENNEAKSYDKHCFMTDEYVRFFMKYHPNIPLKSYEIIYAWRNLHSLDVGSSNSIDYDLEDNKIHAVFGGQLTSGRGLEFLLSCSDYLYEQIPNMVVHMVGKGKLAHKLKHDIEDKEIKNIRLIGELVREDYLQFLSQCDIGLVITQAGVSVPSFPSKILDYMLTKKPVIACCSDLSDYSKIIENDIRCGLGCFTGDIKGFVQQIKLLSDNKELRKTLGEQGHQFMLENMDIRSVSSLIIR